MPEPHLVELRGMCPRETIDVLDAVSTARRMSRTELVNEVLGKWASDEMHVAQAICSVMRVQGSATDGGRN
jgi:hypothetical protein